MRYHFTLNSKSSLIGLIIALPIVAVVVIFFAALLPIVLGLVILGVFASLLFGAFRKKPPVADTEKEMDDEMVINITPEEGHGLTQRRDTD